MHCSGTQLKDPVTSLIDCLGDTKVLSREVEGKLTRIIKKGLNLEAAIATEEVEGPLSVSEVVKLTVSPGSSFNCIQRLLKVDAVYRAAVFQTWQHGPAKCCPAILMRTHL